MKVNFFIVALSLLYINRDYSQSSETITVGGDFDKFYPVSWTDGNWGGALNIGRSNVHDNSFWRRSVISEFAYHVTL